MRKLDWNSPVTWKQSIICGAISMAIAGIYCLYEWYDYSRVTKSFQEQLKAIKKVENDI